MRLARFFSHRNVFVFYALLVLGLGIYWMSIHPDGEAERLREHFLQTTMRDGIEMAGDGGEIKRQFIEKAAYTTYPTLASEHSQILAWQIVQLTRRTEKSLQVLYDSAFSPSFHKKYLLQIEECAGMLRDSLLLLTTRDSTSAAEINSLLEPSRILAATDWLPRADTAQVALWRSDLVLKIRLAQYAALNCLSGQMVDYNLAFDTMLPVLLPRNDGVMAGEPFSADVFLAGYYTEDTYLKFFVDGQGVRSDRGKARYRHTFHAPGLKKLMVEAQVRNPLTETIKVYRKEFQIYVLAQ